MLLVELHFLNGNPVLVNLDDVETIAATPAKTPVLPEEKEVTTTRICGAGDVNDYFDVMKSYEEIKKLINKAGIGIWQKKS